MNPSVVALFVCRASRAPLITMDRVQAVAGSGIEGDRHAKPGSGRQVLLMDWETLEALRLAPGDVREQVTVRGLDLDAVGHGTRMRIGGALVEIAGPCQPCERMNELRPGLRDAIAGRRGRFVRVIESGSFAVGDPLILDPPE